MKFKFTTFLLLFGLLSLFAQEKTNQLNAKGERDGIWEKYYANGNLRYRGHFENGKETGTFKFYSMVNSDFPIIVKSFSKENSEADVKFYTEKGVLESEGKMNGKNREGEWEYYYANGKTLMIIENYKDGVLDGLSKFYYINGKVNEEMNYVNGKLDGKMKRFSDSGILLDDLNYKNGKREGDAKYYNLDGDLISAGKYRNDEKFGKWDYFHTEENSEGKINKQ